MKDVLGITCSMDTSIIQKYQDEITYLQSLLDANGIPYDYEGDTCKLPWHNVT